MKFQVIPLVVLGLTAFAGHADAQGKPGGQGPVPVIVAPAYTDRFVDRVEAIGTLRANETITLASTVTETVTAVNFEDGQRVRQGDILVEMTDSEEKALLNQQRALVNEASKRLERAKELARTGAASTSALEEAQREASSTRAGLAALQSRLEDHIIVAPFDGVVGLRNISVGALLQPATQITTLDDDSVMKLDFSVPSVFLPTLRPGVEIVAKASGFQEEFRGKVSAIDSQIDEATRSIRVRAIIPNPEAKLKPGLLMTVELLKNPRDSVTIAENAIVPEGRKHSVFVVDEAKMPPVVEKREIVIGTRRQGEVEVVDNLVPGEKVVVHGTMMVRDGQPVTITAVQDKGQSLKEMVGKNKEPAQGKPEERPASASAKKE